MKITYMKKEEVPRKSKSSSSDIRKMIKQFIESGEEAAKIETPPKYKDASSFKGTLSFVLKHMDSNITSTIRNGAVYIMRGDEEKDVE